MFFPSLNDNIGILVDNRFYLLHVAGLNLMSLNKDERGSVPIEFRHAVIAFNMDMDRFVLFTVKEKRESEKSKNLRHHYQFNEV